MAKTSARLLVVLSLLLIAVPGYSESGPLADKTLCLDPGHGGADPGAVYSEGGRYLEEDDINLDVAYGLKALLEGDGGQVVMTRTSDKYHDNRSRYTTCNASGADVLVSIHTNSVTDSSWDGSMALYFQSDDLRLAETIQQHMYPYLKLNHPPDDRFDESSFRDFGLSKFASGVLLKSDMPAAMMEPVFMSNPLEAEWLVMPIYDGSEPNAACTLENCRRAQIAQAIYEGILIYFGGGGGDAPPTVIITTPEAGSEISAEITITASASDDTGVSKVEFFVDSTDLATDEDGTDGWSMLWDTTAADDGSHTITAMATDTIGQTSSHSISITVRNSNDGIMLAATGSKDRGTRKVDLTWSGATVGADINVYRNGSISGTTTSASFTDILGKGITGSFTYQVCESEIGGSCSNQVAVTF